MAEFDIIIYLVSNSLKITDVLSLQTLKCTYRDVNHYTKHFRKIHAKNYLKMMSLHHHNCVFQFSKVNLGDPITNFLTY